MRISKSVHPIFFSAAFLASCSLAAQLGAGSASAPDSSPRGSERVDAISGGPPQVTIEPGERPPWCGDYEPNKMDSAIHYMSEDEGWHRKQLNYAARAACDVVSDERAAKIQEWKASYMEQFSASESDFVAAMHLNMEDKAVRDAHDAYCETLAVDNEAGPKDRVLNASLRYALQCESSAPSNQLYWLDLPEVSELQRAALVGDCFGNTTEHSDFAQCGSDLTRFDRAKLDRELAAMEVPEVVRIAAVEFHGEMARRARELMAELEAKAEKDEGYTALLAAQAKTVEDWHKSYDSNKASFAAVQEMEQVGSDMNRKQAKGCGDKLRPLFQKHMKRAAKGKSFASLAEARAVVLDDVGYPLATALVICDILEERLHEGLQGGNFVKNSPVRRGPRYAGYHAFLQTYNDLREDRPRFLFGDALSLPEMPGEVTTETFKSMAYNKVSQGRMQGQIKKITKKGDMATISFEKVKYRDVEEYGCKHSKRISRINADGSVEYQLNCKQRWVDRVSTTEPIQVPTSFIAGLEKGLMVVFFTDKNTGLPEEVYKSKDKKKLIGLLGAVWN